MDDLNGLDLVLLRRQLPDGVTGAEAIATSEAEVPAATVGVNHAYRLQQHAVQADRRRYADALIRWDVGACHALAPIGIVDTGVDSSVPALAGVRVVS
ncbi:hypothetical protein [Yoonia sp. SS1-5]|uniref:Uncharacterized protein n=1 Tax=Yoonia rhodophyticola TaxID=3137370 RepID=A0AAN0MCQ5_9RHOB